MASSTDFKKLYEKYQAEGQKQGISIVQYCAMNGIVYQQFERWFKKYHSGSVMPVEIVDKDGLMEQQVERQPSTEKQSLEERKVMLSHVNLVFSNGLQVNHHHIDYPTLVKLVEKLEALC